MRADAPSSELTRLAENLWEYEPTAVLLEPDGALRAYKGEALRSAIAAAHANERAPVVLYDAFRAPDNKSVMAIQTLEGLCHPRDLNVYCNDEPKPHQKTMLGSSPCACAIQRIQITPPRHTAPLRMKVEANNHSTEIIIPPYPFADWRKVALTQVVVQKDYPMVWIRDHALLYHRAHGYERMVVYDNGSNNIAKLKDCLAQLDEGLQVLLIRWPFPMHRPYVYERADLPCSRDTYAQVAALNHHLHLLASRSIYVSHFDLDEYLLNRSEKPLVEYLNNYLVDGTKDALHIWTERVANVTKQARNHPVRATHFKWQSRDVTRRLQWGYKMIYRASHCLSKNLFVYLHLITPLILDSGIQNSEVRDSKTRNSGIKKRPFFRRVISYPLLKLRQWCRIDTRRSRMRRRIQSRIRQFLSRLSRAYPPDLHLFHYDGIRTSAILNIAYKNPYRLQRLPWNPLRHRRNDEMPKLLTRIGLGDENDRSRKRSSSDA